MLLSGTNYTRRLPSEDERQELRDALERFEIPSTDLPPVALSPLDTLTISLPFPEALAYAGFEKLIAESGNAAAATDKDACRATLLSGLTFEFWPAEENGSRLVISNIIAESDTATGQRFHEAARIVASFQNAMPEIGQRAIDEAWEARFQSVTATLGERQVTELGATIASLRKAGFDITVQPSTAHGISTRVFRAPDISYYFNGIEALTFYARSLDLSPGGGEPPKTPTRAASVAIARPSGPRRLIPLYLVAIGLVLAYALYRWLG